MREIAPDALQDRIAALSIIDLVKFGVDTCAIEKRTDFHQAIFIGSEDHGLAVLVGAGGYLRGQF